MNIEVSCGESSEALYAYLNDILIPLLALHDYDRNDVLFQKWHFTAEDNARVDNLLPLIAEVREYDLRQVDAKVVLCLARRIFKASNALAYLPPGQRMMTVVPETGDWPDPARARWAAIMYLFQELPTTGAPPHHH